MRLQPCLSLPVPHSLPVNNLSQRHSQLSRTWTCSRLAVIPSTLASYRQGSCLLDTCFLFVLIPVSLFIIVATMDSVTSRVLAYRVQENTASSNLPRHIRWRKTKEYMPLGCLFIIFATVDIVSSDTKIKHPDQFRILLDVHVV